jgi:2-polyprenyl-6-methoxyphenol hydroxylase-like FAD-dependent oxidoreductase
MLMPPDLDTDVFIAGAGPTGLVLALWLKRLGVRVRIVDKTLESGTTSRALAVQARTLEFYGQVGLADAVVARARPVQAANLWVAGKKVARAVFGDMGAEISPFPNPLIFPQDEHERLLIEHLGEAGVYVERNTELLGFQDSDGQVVVRLKGADGAEQRCSAAFLAGCDGARSKVREALNIGFPGGTYQHLFYVADVEATGAVMNGELHIGFDKSEFLAVFPLKDAQRVRLVGTLREDSAPPPVAARAEASWNDVGKRVIEWMNIEVLSVNWFSTYRVHHRVADCFRKGRAFLLGDAAHIHSPVGGQGMNTGIGDAVNLAWKLAAVLHGRASEALLDSYEPERIAFARRLVETTDRAFTAVTGSSALATRLRLNVVPVFFPLLFAFKALRRVMFRTVSQTGVNYRASALSLGQAGSVHGGDRLPWVADPARSGADNFAALTSLDWQVHVYGEASAEMRAMCDARRLPLQVFAWRRESARAGLRRDAAYLVRPDGYIAVAIPNGGSATLETYFATHKLACAGEREPLSGSH